MFSLTVREQSLIAAVLLAVVGGRVIHHLRTRTPADSAVLAQTGGKTSAPAEDNSAP